MKIGFVGLGKMGLPMVRRLLAAGHEVVVTDHHQENIDTAVSYGATAAGDSTELAALLPVPAVIWLMIPASRVTDELERLLPTLQPGSIIIDGGNSDFRDTRRHAERCATYGVPLVDVGTSGGVLGLDNGYCTMAGGERAAYEQIEPLLQALSQPGGYGHVGPSGAGHYVKMVHNGIEYGLMQAYAEGFRLLKEGKDYPEVDVAAVAELWQHGSIVQSGLNAIIAAVLKQNPELQGIDGFVAESGEGRWTVETAMAQAIETPVLAASLAVRLASRQGGVNYGTKLLAATRNGFGGHAINAINKENPHA
ncbi:decarboxylating 6-phosphogluconate dehydrogenase [Candidatus Saccharibacteria bacterium]|nr:decarboxylating 6-phosphogluconate dehydrogenase [Candidatus Saccharibacteria bacterium]